VKTLLSLNVTALGFSGCSQTEQSWPVLLENIRFQSMVKYEFLDKKSQVVVDCKTGMALHRRNLGTNLLGERPEVSPCQVQ
jgi:hypothetical protein